jgi:hypothetical protein
MGIKVTRDNTMITCRIVNKKGVFVTTHPLSPSLSLWEKEGERENFFPLLLLPLFFASAKERGQGVSREITV